MGPGAIENVSLHSDGYANALHVGALLLVDVEAEEPGGYASDITRTVPVGGVWAAMPRQLYGAVLLAQQKADRGTPLAEQQNTGVIRCMTLYDTH